MTQGRDQDLLREVQKGRVEFALDDLRPLHSVGDFPQKLGITLGACGRARGRGENGLVPARREAEPVRDQATPGFDVGLDPVLPEHFEVFHRVADRNPCPAQRAVRLRAIPRTHARDHHVHDVAIEKRDDPVDRPDESELAVPPAHRFREGDRQHGRRNSLAQDIGGRRPRHGSPHADTLTLRSGKALQLAHHDALRAGEPLGGLRRTARCVERRLDGRTGDLLHGVGLPVTQASRPDRETPRRAEGLDVRVDAEVEVGQKTAGLELVEQSEADIVQGAVDHPGRDLLCPDLEKEHTGRARPHRRPVSAPAAPFFKSGKPSASRVFRNSLAQPTERRRTLWMNPVLSVTLMAPRASRTLNVCEHRRA